MGEKELAQLCADGSRDPLDWNAAADALDDVGQTDEALAYRCLALSLRGRVEIDRLLEFLGVRATWKEVCSARAEHNRPAAQPQREAPSLESARAWVKWARDPQTVRAFRLAEKRVARRAKRAKAVA